MIDPNVIAFLSVIIGAIAIIAGLGGVILGSKLNSRSMMDEAKRKRNEEKIEEIYTLVMQVDKWAIDAHSDMDNALEEKNLRYDLKSSHYEEIEPAVNRITTLVRLYLRHSLEVAEEFFNSLSQLRDCQGWLFIASTRANLDEKGARKECISAFRNFEACYEKLLSTLEKLVK